MIYVVSCILDKFVGPVLYVNSLGAGRISFKEVYLFVRTVRDDTESRCENGTQTADAAPRPSCSGANMSIVGLVACIIACPIQVTFSSILFLANSQSSKQKL